MTAEQQARDLFDRFKKYYPNSKDEFEISLPNLQKWQWSVNDYEERISHERTPFLMPQQGSAKVLASSRQVRVFGNMAKYMQDKFSEIASHFPGRKVYACGSRVTGEYVEKDSAEPILQMRKSLLKKEVAVSDYDVFVEMKPGEDFTKIKKGLPAWADLIINLPKDEPKILIPMWDFSKLPQSRFNEVLDLVEKKQWGKLMDLHNELKLSIQFYCCDSKPARRWFEWAIKKGIIYAVKESGKMAE